jgi:hypothetical protein
MTNAQKAGAKAPASLGTTQVYGPEFHRSKVSFTGR